LRIWHKTILNKFKFLKINNKSRNTEFRRPLFNSEFFKQKKIKVIINAISQYNQTEFTSGISRQEAESYNTKLETKNIDFVQLVKSDDLMALKIRKENVKSIKKVEAELHIILVSILDTEEKISKIAFLIVERQSETKDLIKLGFSGLAILKYSVVKG